MLSSCGHNVRVISTYKQQKEITYPSWRAVQKYVIKVIVPQRKVQKVNVLMNLF